jgi:hypothetical protein
MTANSALCDPRWPLGQPRPLRKTTETPRGTLGERSGLSKYQNWVSFPSGRRSSGECRSSTIYSKLEQGAKGCGPSDAWFGRKKYDRKTDPLLRYIHHARNADEHGLEAVTSHDPASLSVGGGGTYKTKVIEGGHLPHLEITYLGGPPPQVTFTGPRLSLAGC